MNEFGNAGGVGSDNAAMVFQSEVELLSLRSFDLHVRIRFGGLVVARSVKVSWSVGGVCVGLWMCMPEVKF